MGEQSHLWVAEVDELPARPRPGEHCKLRGGGYWLFDDTRNAWVNLYSGQLYDHRPWLRRLFARWAWMLGIGRER